jgi:predicted nuclease of predicted toxin-antitoxin system
VERLLIDECLSQALLAVAKARGIQADHVVWLGKGGMQDWNLVSFALDHDYALVTSNRRDFLREYARLSAHDGLIILVPMVERNDQVRLFGLMLDRLQTLPDTTNKLVEIFSDGEIRVRDWSASDSDPSYVTSPGRQP